MNTLYPNTVIRTIEFGAASRGWRCSIYYGHQTHRQSTFEHHSIEGNSPEHWVGLAGMVYAFLDCLLRCAVFAYRGRMYGGGNYNRAESNVTQRVADWLIGLINDRFGVIEGN